MTLGIKDDLALNIEQMTQLLEGRKRFLQEKNEWIKQGGDITRLHPILEEYSDEAGETSGHYFHQDLLVASFIHQRNPTRHIDVGSRLDGFVAHVASYRKIEVFDIRKLKESCHKNIVFTQLDVTKVSEKSISDSISCLHAIEHFGLGRYGDEIDVVGHEKGIDSLVSMLKRDGFLYLSMPIGSRDEVHFNAHRIFHPQTILRIPSIENNLKLTRFDFVDDEGDLNLDTNINSIKTDLNHGCGIYTFQKKN